MKLPTADQEQHEPHAYGASSKPSPGAAEAQVRTMMEIVKQFQQNLTEGLSDARIANACRDRGMTWLDSKLNPVVTIQIFLLQILHGITACQHMARLCNMSFTAAESCKARISIELEVFEILLSRCVGSIQKNPPGLGRWFDRRVK